MRAAPLILVIPTKVGKGAELADPAINLAQSYLDAIMAVGGIPWVLPRFTSKALAAECVARADGCLLVGGDDMRPDLYRKRTPKALRDTLILADDDRAIQEFLVLDEVFRLRKPLFAICRGMQILNVAFGGTLYVDIPSEVAGALDHRCAGRASELTHEVRVAQESLLSKVIEETTWRVNSSHHQAVREPAGLFCVTGVAPDGVPEAMELAPAHAGLVPFLLAVQCHPERLFPQHKQFLKPFAAFVQAAAASRKKRL